MSQYQARQIPDSLLKVASSVEEYQRLKDFQDRRLYLYGSIDPLDMDCDGYFVASTTSQIVEAILEFNREDYGKPVEERRPIRLYINSPGGDLYEGFALVDAIAVSTTPVHTINVGMWASMSFLIGITGHRRYTLPHAVFLLHDGSSFNYGSTNKVQDKVDFEKRYETEVVKAHVLGHSKMKAIDYDALARVEYYMLPGDALERGFVDKIIDNVDAIL